MRSCQKTVDPSSGVQLFSRKHHTYGQLLQSLSQVMCTRSAQLALVTACFLHTFTQLSGWHRQVGSGPCRAGRTRESSRRTRGSSESSGSSKSSRYTSLHFQAPSYMSSRAIKEPAKSEDIWRYSLSSLRFAQGQALSEAKDLVRRTQRSFASLRVTGRTTCKSAHGKSYLEMSAKSGLFASCSSCVFRVD